MIPVAWEEIEALDLGALEPPPTDAAARPITGIKADSRVVGPGDLFVALNTGVQHVADAAARGAATLVPNDQEAALAVCVPYLMLAGVAIGGWLTAKAHDLAVKQSAQDPDFFAAKQQISRFYATNLLPEAQSLARVVKNGAAAILEADPAKL